MTQPGDHQLDGTGTVAPAGARPATGVVVAQNVAALLAGRVAGVALAMVTSILLVRHLGSEQLGHYGAVYAYTTLFAWLAAFGLESIITREAARRHVERADLMATGVWLAARFGAAAPGRAVGRGALGGCYGRLHVLVVLAAVEMLLLAPLRLREVVFRVEMKQWTMAGIGLLRQTAWLVLLAGLVLAGAPLLLVVTGRLVCAAGESLLIWRSSRQLMPATGRVLSGETAFLLKQALPVALGVLAAGIYRRIDQVMLHNMIGDRHLGHYVASINLVEPLEMMPAALLGALFPLLAQSVADPARLQRYLDMSFRLLAIASFAACVLLNVAGAPLLVLFYGEEFRASLPALQVLVWSLPVVFLGTILGNVNTARNRQVINLAAGVGGAAANVGLNLLFIPRWGIEGAAGATLVSYLVAWIVVQLISAGTRDVVLHGLRVFVPSGVACAAALAVTSLARLNWWWAIPAAAAIYAAGLFAMGVVRRQDVEWTVGTLRAAVTKPEAAA